MYTFFISGTSAIFFQVRYLNIHNNTEIFYPSTHLLLYTHIQTF